ncbi:MAG TPA: pilus assembly protein TadG-related protein [Terriglobales bacterium]|nr:pilus assembly protein TadG-related protein [Terriglobales bacterium]
MILRFKKEKGQALPLVTLSLFAMCGLMGLAVDLGWSYFVKREAQTAADAAAEAAVQKALDTVGQTGPITCSGGLITCQPAVGPCNASGNLTNGCLYAQQHGFTVGGNGGRQNVTIQADTTSPAPTAPGVKVDYWVTVRAAESIPQLFSAVLGNTVGTSASRATAAIMDSLYPAQFYALNRENDDPSGSKKGGTGNDVSIQGGGGINIFGAATLASTDSLAGRLGGSGYVNAGATYIRGAGGYSGTGSWNAPPINGMADGPLFQDPMQGKGQPPAPTGLKDFPVLGGTVPAGSVLPSGNYFAVDANGKPTGQPLTFGAGVTFKDGSFGNWVIFGGIQGNVSIGPGRYILAGSATGTTVNWDKSMVTDQTPLGPNGAVPPTDAGELFVLTDHNYPGLQIPPALSAAPAVLNSLAQGNMLIKSGNAALWGTDLHGLNPDSLDVPPELKPFAPTLFFQDQANSTVQYTPNGYIACPNPDDACLNKNLKDPSSTSWTIEARPNVQMWGTIYQPRGAGIAFQGHGALSAPVQLITGYVSLQGGPTINFEPMPNGLRRRIAALIE